MLRYRKAGPVRLFNLMKRVDMRNIDESVFIAPGAQVVGSVRIGKDSAVWYNAVIRGDAGTIKIGERTNAFMSIRTSSLKLVMTLP